MRELDPADAALERSLRALRPAPARLDRDQLMFEAGARSRAAGPAPREWLRSPLWPGLAAAFAALSLTLAVALFHPPTAPQRDLIAQARPQGSHPASGPTPERPGPERAAARTAPPPPWPATLFGGTRATDAERGLPSYRELRAQIAARGADALPSTELGLAPLPELSADDPLLLTLGRRLLPGRDRLRARSQTLPEGELQ